MKLSRVGVDLAKNVYQLHGVDRHGKTVWKRRLRRAPLSSLDSMSLRKEIFSFPDQTTPVVEVKRSRL